MVVDGGPGILTQNKCENQSMYLLIMTSVFVMAETALVKNKKQFSEMIRFSQTWLKICLKILFPLILLTSRVRESDPLQCNLLAPLHFRLSGQNTNDPPYLLQTSPRLFPYKNLKLYLLRLSNSWTFRQYFEFILKAVPIYSAVVDLYELTADGMTSPAVWARPYRSIPFVPYVWLLLLSLLIIQFETPILIFRCLVDCLATLLLRPDIL